MKESERCQHPDCIYRARNVSDKSMLYTGNCNFATMTGRSRIAGLPDKLSLPCNCIEYVPNGENPNKYRQAAWKEKAMVLYNAGATDREIAAAVGMDRDRIGEWRRKLGLKIHRDRKGQDPSFDWKRAQELYRRGYNDKAIAEAIGCSVSAVWRWRFKYELFPNDHGGRKKKGARK